MTSTGMIPRKPGISKMIFIISLIIVAAVSGVSGYLINGYLHPSAPGETLNGAGATFPYPLLSAIALNYSRGHTNVAINYQSIGSGGGINALIKKTVDFAASDAPLNALQRGNATNSLHIPETVGAVVVAYNVLEPDGKTSLPTGLHLNATVIAKIFMSSTPKPIYWNDSSIQQLNPGLASVLPYQQIITVHRSDSSGTTFVFTGYLNTAASSVWTHGQGTAVAWDGGLGASGNEGVAGVIRGTSYTLGYVELAYAITNNMKDAFVQNHDGNNYVKPSLTNVTYAVTNATSIFPKGNESWFSVNLLNGPGTNTYPIASFSYLLVYQELNVVPGMTLDKAKALVDFLWFTVHTGQLQAPPLSYVPLPQSIVHIDEITISSITYNGQTLPT